MTWKADEGTPWPLGTSFVAADEAYNFALYSKHATSATLLLFGDADWTHPVANLKLDPEKNKTNRVWHCRVSKATVGAAKYYAYRIDGPQRAGRDAFHAFDSQKILLDPYATTVVFPPGFDRSAAYQAGDNSGKAPLGQISAASTFDWTGDQSPWHESDLIIYEMHIRGFTRNPNSGVSEANRGTYAGIAEKIGYLKDLGVTAVELMPVYQFDPQEGNYWGYMPLGFFAAHSAYAASAATWGQADEFRTMVKALHGAGIEVILDVVYNHTTEGGAGGPCYGMKGIDNSTYYLADGSPAGYADYSGTGNTLYCANRAVRKLVLDSMRYWVKEMHVDGFRFDLASIFSRNSDGSLNTDDPPIFAEMAADPELADVRLIAEPWDAGGAYQLGRNFPGLSWMQWNGRYRDDIKRYIRSEPNFVASLMTRFYGSDDLFPDDLLNANRPVQSVNYAACHDGFTLYDTVAYNDKHNDANGFNNTDGPSDNLSWNCGYEGDAGAPADVLRLRRQQIKNFFTLLMLSNGTPMFRMGDEFSHTQGGNSNPWNQDNATSWLDWDRLQANRDIYRFVQRVIAFRKAHPSICRSRFWRSDISWFGTGADADLSYDSRSIAFCLRGASQRDSDLYVISNAYWQDLDFQIQVPGSWRRMIDTSLISPSDIADPGGEPSVPSSLYHAAARSTVVLMK